MATVTAQRTIDAPPTRVFTVVSDPREFQRAIPHVVGVEHLTAHTTGKGARFRETRRRGKGRHTVELEVTEYAPSERVRMIADQEGAIWDTLFTVTGPPAGPTTLTMTMDARPHTFMARLITPLIMGMVGKAVGQDLDMVKAYCETSNAAGSITPQS